MCGIAGILNFNNKSVDLVRLKAMTDAIFHRGPDGEGNWLSRNGNLALGHRRLSIIDLSTNASQPMHYLDKRYTITFNGEIYNYIELRAKLTKKGYKFISDSDTEVLMALYDDKKENCLFELDGMFAFAIWDEKEQQLFCARDRFGEKPFHYYIDGNEFIFGSEIKQIWAAGVKKVPNLKFFKRFYNTGTVEFDEAPTQTFFKNVEKLDNACFLKIDFSGKLILKKYWGINLTENLFKGNIEEAAEHLNELLMISVKRRLRSDVAVGSSLSGGLDSSAIVSMISKLQLREKQQHTFSARFAGFEFDEGKHIEQLLKSNAHIKAHCVWLDANYTEGVFEKVKYYQDEPFGSTSILAQYAVMEKARQNGVTVLLDGQGADEYLAGYPTYYHLYMNQLYYNDNKLYNAELKGINDLLGSTISTKYIVNENLRMKAGRLKKYFLGRVTVDKNSLKRKLRDDMTTSGLKSLLRYADRNSMAHSIEVRLPFLNHDLVEFVFTLPDSFLLNKGWTKYVLRMAMNNMLPNSICWRKDKIGYASPQHEWLKNDFYLDKINRAKSNLKDLPLFIENSNISENDWRILMIDSYIN